MCDLMLRVAGVVDGKGLKRRGKYELAMILWEAPEVVIRWRNLKNGKAK